MPQAQPFESAQLQVFKMNINNVLASIPTSSIHTLSFIVLCNLSYLTEWLID